MRHPYSTMTLLSYSDKKLGANLSGKVEEHLKECSLCLKKAGAFKLSGRMLGSLEGLEVPEGFRVKANRRLDEAIAASAEMGALERATRRVLEDIRTALMPPSPVLVKAVVTLLLLLAVFVGTPYYFMKLPLNVTAVSGNVEIYSARSRQWIDATKNMALSRSDSIKTGPGGRIDVGVDRTFTVRVKGNTELKMLSMLPRFRKGLVSYEVTRGEVLVDIAEKFKGSHFEVYTPQAVGRAIGTSFAVDVYGAGKKGRTWLGVVKGAVEVASRYLPDAAEQRVLVREGQKTEVITGRRPVAPSLLLEHEWERLKELYRIGHHTRVILLISATESRVRELLRPCALYIRDMEPRAVSDSLKRAAGDMSAAVAEKNLAKHLSAVNELQTIVETAPDREYNPQLLLFIGTYYAYLSQYEEAMEAFESVVNRYPDSHFASLAQCAIGIIYSEELGKATEARKAFEGVLENYPDSPERFEAEKALGIPKS